MTRRPVYLVEVLDAGGDVGGWLAADGGIVNARWEAWQIPHLAVAQHLAATTAAHFDMEARVVQVFDVEVAA